MKRDKKLLSPKAQGKLYVHLVERLYARGKSMVVAVRIAGSIMRIIETV